MIRETRRDFLKKTAAAGSALALPSTGILAAEQPAGSGPLDMSIIRWGGASPADPEVPTMAAKLTEKAVAALGGMERFVGKGDIVWIKPNMSWDRTPEQAANTNPEVVATLIKLCLNAGAKKVRVGDHSCNEASKAYPKSGIEAAAKAAGADVLYLDDTRYREMVIGGEILDKQNVYPEAYETDLIINVPIVKHHRLTDATVCMKNYMGLVDNGRKKWHQNLPVTIADFTAFIKPRLCVVDAIRILMDHGPTGGDLADVKRMNTIAAGTDIVALDAFGAELLGRKASDIGTIAEAAKRGLGQIDYRKLRIEESSIS